ncbi:hypothetical protein [Lysobacter gummosus]|uniref:hypothetical protein n=2 Tax=Lysobacter gummosus TaxID=262324 RepID=UPI00362E63EF
MPRPEADSRLPANMLPGKGGVFARWVSILLHPFVVFIGLTMLSARALAPRGLWPSLIGVALAVVATGAFIAHRRRGGHWTTVDASRSSERPLLYAVLLGVLAICWWWMRERAAALAPGIAAVAAMLVVAALCNRWIKLSLHMASMAFAAVSLSALSPSWALAGAVLLPLLGWARVRMARHTLMEVIGGTALGAVAALALQVWVG